MLNREDRNILTVLFVVHKEKTNRSYVDNFTFDSITFDTERIDSE